MTELTRTGLDAEANASLADNTTNQITAADSRNMFLDLIQSAGILNDTNAWTGANTFSNFLAINVAFTITDSSSSNTASLTLSAQGDSNGANFKLIGQGVTTPSKTIQVAAGVFQILSDARVSIFSLTDAGALTVPTLTPTNPLGVAYGGTGIASFGTGVATALGVSVGTAGAFVVNGGALGTPSGGTLTNATGLPISTGVSGLGTGVEAGLVTAVTGSGGIVLATSPTIATPTIASVNGQSPSGFINRIINGAMTIDQRNNGSSQTFTAAAALAYCVDRFYGYCTGANVTGQRVALAGTASSPALYAYRFTGAASVTGIGFAQRISANNSFDFASGNATLTVNLANSLLTTVTWHLYYANTADTFGSLGSPTVTSIASGTFTVTSTLTTYTAAISSISASAVTGLQLVLSVGAQISGTWTIGNVSLTPVTVQTPFERRPNEIEHNLCYDYAYFNSAVNSGIASQVYGSAFGASTTTASAFVTFPKPMRTTPTLTTSAGNTFLYSDGTNTYAGSGTPAAGVLSPFGATVTFTVATTVVATGGVIADAGAATSFLGFSAEL